MQGKETELGQKKFDLEKQLEVAEAETLTVRSDLKLALKRVEDLQAAIAGEIDSDNSDDNSSQLGFSLNHQPLWLSSRIAIYGAQNVISKVVTFVTTFLKLSG